MGNSSGLDLFNKKTQTFSHFYQDPNSIKTLCDNFIVSLCEDTNGNIWIGTQSGVNKFNKKNNQFTYYSEKDGLPSNIVYEIIEDNLKNIWFTTGMLILLNFN